MKKAAFNALYREHYPQVFGLCRRMLGNTHNAEDAAQEVFLKAYRKIALYDEKKPFLGWVMRIASNHCIDGLRRQKRLVRTMPAAEMELDQIEDPAANAEHTLLSEHEAIAIGNALDSLPEKYRVPLVLAYYADASYEQIAQHLGVSVNNVGVLLLRAKKLLRQALVKHEKTTTSKKTYGDFK